MAKQTSSRASASAPKRKTSEAPPSTPVTGVIAKPEKEVASGLVKATAPSAAASRPAPSQPTHQAVAQRAYELYQTRAHGEGSELNDWLHAERDLRV